MENLSPRIPRSTLEKQDSGSNASLTPLTPPEIPHGEEDREDVSDSSDVSACSATYSNLGKHLASAWKCKLQLSFIPPVSLGVTCTTVLT